MTYIVSGGALNSTHSLLRRYVPVRYGPYVRHAMLFCPYLRVVWTGRPYTTLLFLILVWWKILNKNGLFTHKNAKMQATVMTEPEKLTVFQRSNFINCCDNNKTKKNFKTAKCHVHNNLQLAYKVWIIRLCSQTHWMLLGLIMSGFRVGGGLVSWLHCLRRAQKLHSNFSKL